MRSMPRSALGTGISTEVYDYVPSRGLIVLGAGPFQATTSEHLNSESHASPAAVAPWKSQVTVYSPGCVLSLGLGTVL